MLILNIIVIDSLNKILKLFSKCFLHWPRISQSILFEVKWNIFLNSFRMMNHLLIIQISLYSLCYTQYLLVCYHWLKQCVVTIKAQWHVYFIYPKVSGSKDHNNAVLVSMGKGIDNRKIHKLAWKTVVKEKDKGRLSIGSVLAKNKALLFKWIWKLWCNDKARWADYIRENTYQTSAVGCLNLAKNSQWFGEVSTLPLRLRIMIAPW
jgi:hypothetical protein